MRPQLERWERQQRAHGSGYVTPGARRLAYIESLKPAHLRKSKSVLLTAAKDDCMFTTPGRYLGTGTGNGFARTDGYLDSGTAGHYPIRLTWPPTTFSGNTGTATNSIYTLNVGGQQYVPGLTAGTWTGITNITTANVWDRGAQLYYHGYQINGAYPVGVDGHGNVQFVANNVVYAGEPQPQPYDEKAAARAAAKQRFARQLVLEAPQNHRGKRARVVADLYTAADFAHAPGPEIVALELLKGLLPEDEWRRYLRYGFILVTGKSGLTYQIVRGQHHLRVFRRGKRLADLCLYARNVPPTDQVITKKILVECDELSVWLQANIHNHASWPSSYAPTDEELQQLAAGLLPAARPEGKRATPATQVANIIAGNAGLYVNLNAGNNVHYA